VTVAGGRELTTPVKRLRAGATLPRYMTADAAGMDLSAALDAEVELAPGKRALVPCGFAIAIPRGYEGQVRPRSGLALKHGLSIPNAPGTIDSDYRGEVCVLVINLGEEPVRIAPGDRIAQLVICPVTRAELREVDSLDATGRGSGGFGHTA
jgi:dUTP pyrophosphatase